MRTVIDLTEEQVVALKALAELEHLSRAELVRRAVNAYIHSRLESGGEDDAFGLWHSRGEDGLTYQKRLREDWQR